MMTEFESMPTSAEPVDDGAIRFFGSDTVDLKKCQALESQPCGRRGGTMILRSAPRKRELSPTLLSVNSSQLRNRRRRRARSRAFQLHKTLFPQPPLTARWNDGDASQPSQHYSRSNDVHATVTYNAPNTNNSRASAISLLDTNALDDIDNITNLSNFASDGQVEKSGIDSLLNVPEESSKSVSEPIVACEKESKQQWAPSGSGAESSSLPSNPNTTASARTTLLRRACLNLPWISPSGGRRRCRVERSNGLTNINHSESVVPTNSELENSVKTECGESELIKTNSVSIDLVNEASESHFANADDDAPGISGKKFKQWYSTERRGGAYARLDRFAENCIFDYFTLSDNLSPTRVEAKCNLCARSVRATVGVTSNFLTHLRTHHKSTFLQYEQYRAEVTTRRGRPLKSLNQMRQRFSFAMRKRRREIIFSAFNAFQTEKIAGYGLDSVAYPYQARISATCQLCGVTIRGTKTVSSNFYSHLKRKHPEKFSQLNQQAEQELGELPRHHNQTRASAQLDHLASSSSSLLHEDEEAHDNKEFVAEVGSSNSVITHDEGLVLEDGVVKQEQEETLARASADVNTLLISAELGGKCTDLVMPRIMDFHQQNLVLPPTQQLLDFLAGATSPRTETDEFLFYSFEADCLKIVAELRKTGFEIVKMNYLPALPSTTTGSSSAATSTIPSFSNLSDADVSTTAADVGVDYVADELSGPQISESCSETTAEPSAATISTVKSMLSVATLMGGSNAGARMWNNEIECRSREREKVVWLLLASGDETGEIT